MDRSFQIVDCSKRTILMNLKCIRNGVSVWVQTFWTFFFVSPPFVISILEVNQAKGCQKAIDISLLEELPKKAKRLHFFKIPRQQNHACYVSTYFKIVILCSPIQSILLIILLIYSKHEMKQVSYISILWIPAINESSVSDCLVPGTYIM